jgi:hypothetical protein
MPGLAGPTRLVPDLLPVVALRRLVVDAVAYTTDRTGLLERLLPSPETVFVSTGRYMTEPKTWKIRGTRRSRLG